MSESFSLKSYQREWIDDLGEFLTAWRSEGNLQEAFFDATGKDYAMPPWSTRDIDRPLRRVPAVCLQAGTGAGKTVMAAAAIPTIARRDPDPLRLVVWMVPSKTLADQTARNLHRHGAPYRVLLENAFDSVSVVTREQLMHTGPASLANGLTIVVTTYAGLRREDKEGLRAYRPNGGLQAHFADADAACLLPSEDPDVPYEPSMVNLIRLHRPLIVVDESHQAKSGLSWEMLSDLAPRAVLELTATARPGTNVLHRVRPLELKRAEMVRLPVNLYSSSGWQDCLHDGQELRDRLEEDARRTGDRLRPIVLVQAEAKDAAESTIPVGKVSVHDAVSFLTSECNVPRAQIAIQTGEVRELDGLDLLDVACETRYVVTVKAAAEGWDCPYAMILCTVGYTKGVTGVTQLLGRVLRQDLGRRSETESLNQAYVFASSTEFQKTAGEVLKSMQDHGFEERDMVIGSGHPPGPSRERDVAQLRPEFAEVTVPQLAWRAPDSDESVYPLTEASHLEIFSPRWSSEHGIPFPTHAVAGLRKEAAEGGRLIIDVGEEGLRHEHASHVGADRHDEMGDGGITRALVRALRLSKIHRRDVVAVVEATVSSLLDEGWRAEDMYRQFPYLQSAIAEEMTRRYEAGAEDLYGVARLTGGLATVEQRLKPSIVQPAAPAPCPIDRHLYDSVGPMNGEETRLAAALAGGAGVRWWWRIPEKADGSFFLAGAWGRFYPDFLVGFDDGRVWLLEYKGSHLQASGDTARKGRLGSLWSSTAGPQVEFFIVGADQSGPPGIPYMSRDILFQQIAG